MPVAIVQGNHSLATQWEPERHGETLKDYERLSWTAIRNHRPKILIWPESAVTFFLAHDAAYRESIGRFARGAGVELVVGTPHYEEVAGTTRFFSSAFRMRADGTVDGRFDKRQLLPFIEFFPLGADTFLRRTFGRMREMTPGQSRAPLDTILGKTAVAICVEVIFPHLVRRRTFEADILLNLSNDVWLGDEAGPQQHFAMVPFRAIESRTWVIRSTTTGISAVIDPRGRVVERLPRAAEGVLSSHVVPQRVDTFYEKWGDVFGFACLGFAALAAGLTAYRRSRQP